VVMPKAGFPEIILWKEQRQTLINQYATDELFHQK
jgi:hypothetical protein